MVASVKLTAENILQDEPHRFRSLQQILRKELSDCDAPVEIEYGGLPVIINDKTKAASCVYMAAYHNFIRKTFLEVIKGYNMNPIPALSIRLKIPQDRLLSFLRGMQVLTLPQLHRLNSYLSWHYDQVHFRQASDPPVDPLQLCDPMLFFEVVKVTSYGA